MTNVKKNIWIMNHYATAMFDQKGGRHYWFAKNLTLSGYVPTIFCANTYHNNTSSSISVNKDKFSTAEDEFVKMIYVKTTSCQTNGLDRVKNMVVFAKNLFSVTRKYGKLMNQKPDIILASSVHPLTCVAGIFIAKRYKVPCIVEIRDLWPESIVVYSSRFTQKQPLIKLLYQGEKWIYQKANAIIFTMPGGKDYIIERGWDKQIHNGRVDLEKIYYINNGVDLKAFDYNMVHETIEDDDLNNPDIFKVVYTGSIRLMNKVEYLVEVAKELKRQNKTNIKLLLWGNGDQVDAIQSQIDALKLDNIVLKGVVSKKNIPYILSKSNLNIYVLMKNPLYRFGLSMNKSFEYFASGKPVLASANSGHSIIDQYECGICLEEFSPQTMANAMIHFSQMEKSEYDMYCKNARKAGEAFDFKVLTQKLISIIESRDTL